jgi:hypothetical protein
LSKKEGLLSFQFSLLILFAKRSPPVRSHRRLDALEERMDDVRAVMDAAGSERAALFGISEGGPDHLPRVDKYDDNGSGSAHIESLGTSAGGIDPT